MEIKKPYACETCGKERMFRYNTNTNKVYAYAPKCNACTLRERNKIQNNSKRKHPIHNMFNCIDTEETAYIFGFLWADGFMRSSKRKNAVDTKSIVIGIHPKDTALIEYCIKHIGGSSKEIEFLDKRSNKMYQRITWYLHSKDVYDNIIKLNFRKNSSSVPDHLFNHFMRGIVDGDGCFHIRSKTPNTPEIHIASNINQDWSFITDRISFETKIHITDAEKSSSSHLHFLGKDKFDFLKYLYKDATFYLQRKYDIIKHLL